MKILVCNSGSSSLKFSLIETKGEVLLAEGSIDWTTMPTRMVLRCNGQPEVQEELALQEHKEALARILAGLQAGPSAPLQKISDLHAVGHRVVHGGERYTTAVRITPEVEQVIDDLAELAPLHNPASLDGIRAVNHILPEIFQVAVFDTAFHATLPEAARTYAIPQAWTRKWGLRRYGFHGLSNSYCATRAAEMLGRVDSRLIIAHLGNGASVSAVLNGICVDTSMGFTPLEGLVMGTRSGSVDPGILLYALRHKGMSAQELDDALNKESGLLGISGSSSDMRQIEAASKDNPQARLALEVYVHRLRQTIAAMSASLGGVDALVFTAGVGERSLVVRKLACENLTHLGIELDHAANASRKPDCDIATRDSSARVFVISTREDLTIVRETSRLIEAQDKSVDTKMSAGFRELQPG
jgi:acetate kinase